MQLNAMFNVPLGMIHQFPKYIHDLIAYAVPALCLWVSSLRRRRWCRCIHKAKKRNTIWIPMQGMAQLLDAAELDAGLANVLGMYKQM